MIITHTITVFELVWTVFCLPGLYYATRLLWRSFDDLKYLRKRKINSIREYAAVTTMLLFAKSTLVQFMFVIVGIIAMLAKNSPNGTGIGSVLAGIFIFVSVMMTIFLVIIEKRRQALITKIKDIEDMDA